MNIMITIRYGEHGEVLNPWMFLSWIRRMNTPLAEKDVSKAIRILVRDLLAAGASLPLEITIRSPVVKILPEGVCHVYTVEGIANMPEGER
jgi:hypothetical protein